MIPTDKLTAGLNEVVEKMKILGWSAQYTKNYMETLLSMQTWYRPDKRRDRRLKRRGPCGHKWSHYGVYLSRDNQYKHMQCQVCERRVVTRTWL